MSLMSLESLLSLMSLLLVSGAQAPRRRVGVGPQESLLARLLYDQASRP